MYRVRCVDFSPGDAWEQHPPSKISAGLLPFCARLVVLWFGGCYSWPTRNLFKEATY